MSGAAGTPSDPHWIKYADTIIVIDGGRVTVDLRRPLRPSVLTALGGLGLGDAFAIWTAENPEGEPIAPEENRRRVLALEGELRLRGIRFLPAQTVAADGEERETCVVAALPLPAAIDFARKLGQMALMWFDRDHFSLIGARIEAEPVRLPLQA